MLPRASHAAHRTPGTGSPRASARASVAAGRVRTDGRQRLRRVDADVWILVRERLDERADRRAGPPAQRAECACGIACDGHRILVSQRPSQRRLNPRPYGAPGRSRHRRRSAGRAPTRAASRSASSGMAGGPIRRMISRRHRMQVFMLRREESSQQRQRTRRPMDQGGFGGCADLRVVGLQASGPVDGPGRGFWRALDSVGGSGDWDSATVWLRPAASATTSACFLMNDIAWPFYA